MDRRQISLSPVVTKLAFNVDERRKKTRRVGVNEHGLRIGEDHPRSKLSDDDVALILQMLEDADNDKLAGRKFLKDCEIAEKFEVSKQCISTIRHGHRRAQAVDHYKLVEEV